MARQQAQLANGEINAIRHLLEIGLPPGDSLERVLRTASTLAEDIYLLYAHLGAWNAARQVVQSGQEKQQ